MTERSPSPDTRAPARPPEALETALESVEHQLGALGAALRDRDTVAIEHHAAGLHRALAQAVQRFTQAARQPDGVPTSLRQRLAIANAQAAAQREGLARANAALGRAIGVLMPQPPTAGVYSLGGHSQRAPSTGSLSA